jgi:hypothetical protein
MARSEKKSLKNHQISEFGFPYVEPKLWKDDYIFWISYLEYFVTSCIFLGENSPFFEKIQRIRQMFFVCVYWKHNKQTHFSL